MGLLLVKNPFCRKRDACIYLTDILHLVALFIQTMKLRMLFEYDGPGMVMQRAFTINVYYINFVIL